MSFDSYSSPRRGVLSDVREGMPVYDQDDQKIGTVNYVQFGAEDPTTHKIESATAPDPEWRDDSLIDNIAEALGGESDIPDTLRNRMLREGYVKIDTGLLRSDRYALPEHIAGLSRDGIKLNVSRDGLISV